VACSKGGTIVDGGSRIADFKQVLWIRIRIDSQVSAGSPGSGSILAVRIRRDFQPFKQVLVSTKAYFVT
jgi:hypothetical protein